MLTLLETVAAIEALDTNRDVILGACMRLAKPLPIDDNALDTPEGIIRHINATYQYRCDPSILMIAVAELAGASAAILAKPDREVEVINYIHQIATESFARALSHRCTELMKTDPAAAMKILHNAVERIRAKQEK